MLATDIFGPATGVIALGACGFATAMPGIGLAGRLACDGAFVITLASGIFGPAAGVMAFGAWGFRLLFAATAFGAVMMVTGIELTGRLVFAISLTAFFFVPANVADTLFDLTGVFAANSLGLLTTFGGAGASTLFGAGFFATAFATGVGSEDAEDTTLFACVFTVPFAAHARGAADALAAYDVIGAFSGEFEELFRKHIFGFAVIFEAIAVAACDFDLFIASLFADTSGISLFTTAIDLVTVGLATELLGAIFFAGSLTGTALAGIVLRLALAISGSGFAMGAAACTGTTSSSGKLENIGKCGVGLSDNATADCKRSWLASCAASMFVFLYCPDSRSLRIISVFSFSAFVFSSSARVFSSSALVLAHRAFTSSCDVLSCPAAARVFCSGAGAGVSDFARKLCGTSAIGCLLMSELGCSVDTNKASLREYSSNLVDWPYAFCESIHNVRTINACFICSNFKA